jgi:hypothetical protein
MAFRSVKTNIRRFILRSIATTAALKWFNDYGEGYEEDNSSCNTHRSGVDHVRPIRAQQAKRILSVDRRSGGSRRPITPMAAAGAAIW